MSSAFDVALAFAKSNSYLLIFLVMVVEGPTITTAAAFASSLGYLDVMTIFLLSILGDLVGDGIHFALGRGARAAFIEKYGHFVGLDGTAIKKLEEQLKRHLGKTMVVVKMTPVAGVGLLLAGALRVPWKRFALLSLAITLPRAIFFTALGYLFGWAVNTTLTYLAWGEYSLLALLVFLVVLFFVFKKTTKKARARLDV